MSFLPFHNVIQSLTSCLSGVLDLSSNQVIEELNFMSDERIKYLNDHKDKSKLKTIKDIEVLIRYCSDLYYLCECLFFRDKKIKMAGKQLFSLVKDAVGRSDEIIVTDSLIVEWIYKVEELCITFTSWLTDRFNIYQFTKDGRLLLIKDVMIDSTECESVLSCVKYTIGLVNKVKELNDEEKTNVSLSKLINSLQSIDNIMKCMNNYLITLRILGCWICSIGLQKSKTQTIETQRRSSEFLASCLLMIDELESENEKKGLINALVDSIRVDLSITFAKELMGYNNYESAYKYLLKAKSIGWKDTDGLMKECEGILGDRIPTDYTNIEEKPLSDSKYLEKGKSPMKMIQFKLV